MRDGKSAGVGIFGGDHAADSNASFTIYAFDRPAADALRDHTAVQAGEGGPDSEIRVRGSAGNARSAVHVSRLGNAARPGSPGPAPALAPNFSLFIAGIELFARGERGPHANSAAPVQAPRPADASRALAALAALPVLRPLRLV